MSTHNIPFSIYKKRKLHLITPNLQPRNFFLGTQERVRNSRGKRAISVRATEVLFMLKPVLPGLLVATPLYAMTECADWTVRPLGANEDLWLAEVLLFFFLYAWYHKLLPVLAGNHVGHGNLTSLFIFGYFMLSCKVQQGFNWPQVCQDSVSCITTC